MFRTPVSLTLLAATLFISGCDGPGNEFISNDDIVSIAYGYKDGGCWRWEGTGVPEDIWFKNRLILRKDSPCTYSCGFTFAVYFNAAQNRGLLDNLSSHEIRTLQKSWYGGAPEYAEQQAPLALNDSGLGQLIDPIDAQAGDIISFYHHDSIHIAIFLEWAHNEDAIIGFKYRSSQARTNGIGDVQEYFTDIGLLHGTVDPERFHVARLYGSLSLD